MRGKAHAGERGCGEAKRVAGVGVCGAQHGSLRSEEERKELGPVWLAATARHAPVLATTPRGGRFVGHTEIIVAWRAHSWRGGVRPATKQPSSIIGNLVQHARKDL
jgi:hypothetical protein